MSILFHNYQTRSIIRKLINFLGPEKVESCVKRYEQSLSFSGTLSRDFYLKNRHPWWEPLAVFLERERQAKSQTTNVPLSIRRLTRDAAIISVLQRTMPPKIKEKFKIDLLDNENAYAYLLEIHIAWHFHTMGYEINWYEDSNMPEFSVKTPDLSFDVECKRISYDASRRIRKRDFYRLADLLIPKIRRLNIQGTIEIVLKGRLYGSADYLNYICNEILTKIRTDNLQGSFVFSEGEYFLNLGIRNNVQVNIKEKLSEIHKEHKNSAHVVATSYKSEDCSVDPLFLILRSQKTSSVLEGIKKKIQDAAKRQLNPEKAGLIVCFLESFNVKKIFEHATGNALHVMSNNLLIKEENRHLAALAFCAEEDYISGNFTAGFKTQVLSFKSTNCVFEKARIFPFFRDEKVVKVWQADPEPNHPGL